jgi:hypothetical protein
MLVNAQAGNEQYISHQTFKEKVMSALRKMKTYETIEQAVPVAKSAGWVPVVIVTSHGTGRYEAAVPVTTEEKSFSAAKGIALFLAAPFFALAYMLALPIVGLAALVWVAAKALTERVPVVKTIALIAAAPFIGLVFILATPVVGLGLLARMASSRLAEQ